MPSTLTERIEDVRERHAALEAALADPGVSRDPARLRELAKEHARLAPIVEVAAMWETTAGRLEEDRAILRESDDPDLRELARAEIAELEAEALGQ
jgi:peptide chain release factor 1